MIFHKTGDKFNLVYNKPPSKGLYVLGSLDGWGYSTRYVYVEGQHINERHCLLDIESKEKIYIVDLGSATGVYIDGEKITPTEKHPLKLGEIFSLDRQSQAKIELFGREEPISPSPQEPSTSQAKRGRTTVAFAALPISGIINNID
uniref:FHA domain-containing protein n=1 Tax=Glossina palpalis gambiensis TaxID=67801 RepID=A0A1B0BBL6_9MUSC